MHAHFRTRSLTNRTVLLAPPPAAAPLQNASGLIESLLPQCLGGHAHLPTKVPLVSPFCQHRRVQSRSVRCPLTCKVNKHWRDDSRADSVPSCSLSLMLSSGALSLALTADLPCFSASWEFARRNTPPGPRINLTVFPVQHNETSYAHSVLVACFFLHRYAELLACKGLSCSADHSNQGQFSS